MIRSQPTDWRQVVAWLTGPVPGGRRIFYQKHMAHHLLPEVDRGWLGRVTNAFLIRDPAQVLASYVVKRGEVTLDDIGFTQQADLFDEVAEFAGRTLDSFTPEELAKDETKALGRALRDLGAAGVLFGVALFVIGTVATGHTFQDARDGGWLLGSFGSGRLSPLPMCKGQKRALPPSLPLSITK